MLIQSKERASSSNYYLISNQSRKFPALLASRLQATTLLVSPHYKGARNSKLSRQNITIHCFFFVLVGTKDKNICIRIRQFYRRKREKT